MLDSIVESTAKYAGETMTKDLAESLAKDISGRGKSSSRVDSSLELGSSDGIHLFVEYP